MTVKDLIAELQKMPQDLEVISYGEHVDECFVTDEFYDGDYANPNCPVIQAVIIQ